MEISDLLTLMILLLDKSESILDTVSLDVQVRSPSSFLVRGNLKFCLSNTFSEKYNNASAIFPVLCY